MIYTPFQLVSIILWPLWYLCAVRAIMSGDFDWHSGATERQIIARRLNIRSARDWEYE